VCPSCNTRRMAETAAHLTDHVFPRLPVRQWVLSVPKRLRYFLQRDTALQGAVLRILLREVERCLREHSPGCNSNTKARIGAVAFIHRFGSSLNEHVHFHCCIVDGVFQPAANIGDTTDAADAVAGVDFHAATGLDAAAIADVQAMVRWRILRAFVRRGLIGKGDRDEMMGWEHGGGFSLDASVCIGGTDRAGLERLLRYCARPPFALEHLRPLDAGHLIYHNPKPRSDSPRDLVLTPLVCPICQAQMRIIAFIIDASTVRKILEHIGESAQPPRIAPARGPPLWEAAMASEQAGNDPEWDSSIQPEPAFEFDQRIA